MHCIWTRVGDGYVCEHCGWQSPVQLKQPCRPLAPSQPARPLDMSCAHRGEQTRLIQCDECVGAVRIKVYSCAVHGECSLVTRLSGVGGCCFAAAGDYCPEHTPVP